MRGRKPKPTNLKLVAGNPGKRPLPENEPTPESGANPPEWLSAAALAHWPLVAKQLEAAGVLTQMDAAALGLYCESFARWHDANRQVEKEGPLVNTPNGFPVQSPYLQIANKAFDQMTKLLVEFGMTPSSRTRVAAVKKQEEPSQLAKLLGKG